MLKTEIDKKLYVFRKLALFFISLYTSILLFPLIKFNYSNPSNFIGILSLQKFNPFNNIARYLFVIVFTILLYLFFKRIVDAKRTYIFRICLVVIITMTFFFSQSTLYLNKYNNIDLFHDGEQLGVGSAVYFFNKVPYKDMFFLHGAFSDPLIVNTAFHIFKPSIGSHYLFSSLVNIVGIFLFFLMLVFLIKNQYLFYASLIFFYGSLYLSSLIRDLLVVVYALVALLMLNKKLKENICFFLLAFISFSSFYCSVDKGYYLFVINILYFVIYIFFNKRFQLKLNGLTKIIKKNLNNLTAAVFGTFFAIFAGVLFFGPLAYGQFIKDTFIHISLMKPFLDEYQYPQFLTTNVFPYWLPIILICMLCWFVVDNILSNRKKLNRTYILPILFTLMSFLFYRSALGRSDLQHIVYVSHYIFLGIFVSLDYLLLFNNSLLNKILIYITILILFFTPFFHLNMLTNIPRYELSDLNIYFSLPTIDDNYWLRSQDKEVRDYILSHTSSSDSLFLFTNAPVYYYLTKRNNPTRYYTIWFAIGDKYQKEVVADLQKNKPKLILYKDGVNDEVDSLTNSKKLPLINDWIMSNYQLVKTIYSAEIYGRK